MKLTPDLISYLPYIPEGKVVGSYNGQLVRISTNQAYMNTNRPFGTYESPYCLNAENFYIKTLEEIENKMNTIVSGGQIENNVIPLISEDCMVYDPISGEIKNLEVLSKFDKIPSTLVPDPISKDLYIGTPRIIGRTGPTEDKPVFLRSIEDGHQETQNIGIKNNLINFDEVPFVKPVVCLIRKTEEESKSLLNELIDACGNIIAEEGVLTLKKSWGDNHLD